MEQLTPVKSTTKAAQERKVLYPPPPSSSCTASDFANRWENGIYPLLKAGAIVLADRYVFTAFARDVARGVDPEWVRNMYSFAINRMLLCTSACPWMWRLERITAARASLKYYEAGMDLNLSDNIQ
jgi:dTMP kinase